MKYKLLQISALLLFISFPALQCRAQFVDYGQNPPGLHWKQINTPHFQVIFPEKISSEAWRMSGVLEKIYFFENRSLHVNTKPISVILQNQQIESNGFVLLAPRRSEFYTTPPQDIEPTDWLNSLAIHEMRHVVQEDKVFRGSRLQLFESVQLGVFGLVFPSWFFEGDAVGMETALTATGRGRLPSFDREIRTNLLSGMNYSYSKNYLGSLNDNVPDYYRIGYFMVTKMRRDYGDSVFNLIYKRALRLTPWPLSTSLKRYTGYSTPQFYQRTMDELKADWKKQLDEKKPEYYPVLNHRGNSLYSNELLPRPYGANKLIVLKTGVDKTDAFYSVDLKNRQEKRILKIGIQPVSNFDLAGDLLVWDEERYDPRFAYRTYSVLMSYNLKTKIRKRLSYRSRLLGASLSAAADKVISVKVEKDNHYFLEILSTKDGSLLQELPNAENYYFQNPRFDSSATKIIAVVAGNRGKALYQYDLQSNTNKLLGPFSFTEISRPMYAGKKQILFNSSADGIDDIYLHDVETGEEHQVSNSRFGSYNPVIHGDTVYFNLFQSQGQDVSFLSLKEQLNKNLLTENHFINYFKPLVKREAGGSVFAEQRSLRDSLTRGLNDSLFIFESDTTANKLKFKESPYQEIGHFFYFHSLLPSVQQLNFNSNNFLAGVKLQSTNKLNTTQTYLGAYYQNGYNSFQYQAGITYKKFYPYLFTSFVDTKLFSLARSVNKGVTTYVPFSYRESRYNVGLQVPLSFLGGNQTWSAGGEVLTAFVHKYSPSIKLSWTPNLPFPIHYNAYVSRNDLMASRDLYPLWGENINLDFESLPFYHPAGVAHNGTLLYINSQFYFPGLFSHHSFQAGFNFEKSDGVYESERLIDEISGSSFLPANQLKNTLLMNYFLPLAYPDWQISSIAYIRKIQGGVFLDYENLGKSSNPLLKTYSSYGLDFRFDCNLLRYYLPIFQIGTRVIFMGNGISSPKFSLILSYTI